MTHPKPLTDAELASITPGEALTLATVIIVFTVVILTVAAWKLFQSDNANVTTPDGFKFEWDM